MINEELTDKTIRSGDKVKVARVIADMLGVENAETMSPENAINTGLRKIKTKRMTPELIGVLKKMLNLAQDVGVKVDMTLIPKSVSEQRVITKKEKEALMASHKAMMQDASEEVTVDKNSKRNAAGDILRFNDFAKLSKINQGVVPVKEDELDPNNLKKNNPTVPGKEDNPEAQDRDDEHKDNESDFDADDVSAEMGKELVAGNNDQLRRRKIHYKTEEVDLDEVVDVKVSADYKTDKNGRKTPAHRIVFKNGDNEDDADPKDIKEEAEEEMSDAELDKIAAAVDHEDDVIDCYDDNELMIVDQDTGEEVKEDGIKEEALNEVLSRMERMKARIRFLRTSAKRTRRLQVVLKRRSDTATINRRARHLAVKLMKERLMKKPIAQMTVSEKERAEKMIASRKSAVNRLAMRLVPRIRKIEANRMSQHKSAAPAATM